MNLCSTKYTYFHTCSIVKALCRLCVFVTFVFIQSREAISFTSAEEFLKSYDTFHTAKDIVTGQARIGRLDRENGLVLLVHEAVVSVDGSLAMPEMSMALPVVNPVWLHELRPGLLVRFQAARRRGAITLMSIEPVEAKNFRNQEKQK